MMHSWATDTVPTTACLQLAGTQRSIALENASDIATVMRRIAPTWPMIAPTGDTTITARHSKAGYEVSAPWFDEPVRGLSAVSAACSIFVDAARLVLEADPTLLCLHAGAVELGGGLVVLCGDNRAGKSTLATRLAAGSSRLYCDDVLPLDTAGRGIALGVAPRLRLPLPATASNAFADFCAKHVVASDERYGYVLPPTLAAHGERSPLRAIVILDRRQDGSAGLVAASPAEAVHHLVRRNLARHDGAKTILDRLSRLGKSLQAVRLFYSDIDEAAELVISSFSAAAPLQMQRDDSGAGTSLTSVATTKRGGATAIDPDRIWRTRPDVGIRMVAGTAFLTSPTDDAIYELNSTGLACWRVLCEFGASATELSELMTTAFPLVAPTKLQDDIAALLAALDRSGLLETS